MIAAWLCGAAALLAVAVAAAFFAYLES